MPDDRLGKLYDLIFIDWIYKLIKYAYNLKYDEKPDYYFCK